MPSVSHYDYENANRRTLLDGISTLERTNASISRSNQVAIETEQVGTEVISDLNDQREALLRAKERLSNADDALIQSRSLIRRMGHNVVYNKIILIIIIILEALILGIIVYRKFFAS